ncbi:MAG TPA: hypothetical protein ENK32_05375 [Anaerolineae bacterium]|nr:hypothetical protein [Anaerolineae bacterium]
MKSAILLIMLALLALAGGATGARNWHTAAATAVSPTLCPPLDPSTGPTTSVSTVTELENAVNNAAPGDAILIADGTYNLNGVYLRLDTPNVTLRSASGSREAVILDGNYVTTEIIQIAASNVTIADVTLQKAYNHPIHVMTTAAGDTLNTRIYNVHIIDPGEQAIKINPAADGTYPDDGLIACSRIELTDAGRPSIRNNCYTGGIDAHQARGWTVRDNRIEGFWCASGLSEHAVHFWRGSRDTVVERNTLNDNARGVGFGLDASGNGRTYADNPCPGAGGGYVDHYDGIIRNNFVFAGRSELFASEYGFDCGVCLWQACGAQALNNTVVSTQAPFSSIEWRFANTDVTIANNLVSHNLRDRGGAAVLSNNRQNAPLTWFVDGGNGDLHLRGTAVSAIDQAVSLAAVTDDVDGDGRPVGPAPDIGADEWTPSLQLTGAPADQTIYLNWTVDAASLDAWRIAYSGPAGDQPSPVTGLNASARAYTLTGLTNYTPYTVTLNAMLSGSPVLTDTAAVMPTDILLYLPAVGQRIGEGAN